MCDSVVATTMCESECLEMQQRTILRRFLYEIAIVVAVLTWCALEDVLHRVALACVEDEVTRVDLLHCHQSQQPRDGEVCQWPVPQLRHQARDARTLQSPVHEGEERVCPETEMEVVVFAPSMGFQPIDCRILGVIEEMFEWIVDVLEGRPRRRPGRNRRGGSRALVALCLYRRRLADF